MKTIYKTTCARLMTLLVLALLSVSNVWGEDAFYTLSFTQLTSGANVNSYTAPHSITCDEIGWELYGNQSVGAYIRVGGKTTTATDRTLTSTDVISQPISKISINHEGVVNGRSSSITINSITVEGSTSSSFTSAKSKTISNPSVSSAGTLDFVLDEGCWDAKSYYRITVNYQITGSNNCYITINSVDFYAASQSSVATPTFSVASGSYANTQSVELSCATDGATIYYTIDGSEPTSSSTEYSTAITVSKSTTVKAIAIKGEEKSNVASASYKITTYANVADLVADGEPTTTGYPVTVTLTNEVIQSFYTSGDYRNGIFLNYTNPGGKAIEIYCKNVPGTWVAGGTVSGTLANCTWKNYSGTWELCPTSWEGITYTAPKEISSIEIKGTATKTVYTEGEFFNDYSGLTVTATYSDNTTEDVTGLVEWSVSPSTALTTSTNSVTVTATINGVTDNAVVNITVNPEPTNFVWDLTIDDTTTATAAEISWVNAIANIKAGGSATAANNYYPGTPDKSYTSTRFYKGATFTISPKNGHEISSIVLDATTEGYATTAAGTWKNASASKKGLKVTVTPTDGSADVSITLTNTVGLYSIKVYYNIPTEYTRTVTEGNFGTICLPYDGTVEGATLYSIAGKEMDGDAVKNLVLNEEGDELMGGMPYVFKATAGTLTVSYDSNDTDVEDATDFEGLYGTYDAIDALPEDGTVYVISQNQFWCVNSAVSCGANRAYVKLADVNEYTPSSDVKPVFLGNGDLADGINFVVAEKETGMMYNLAGQAVGKDYKGIVIVNGKKMLNK